MLIDYGPYGGKRPKRYRPDTYTIHTHDGEHEAYIMFKLEGQQIAIFLDEEDIDLLNRNLGTTNNTVVNQKWEENRN